MVLADPYARACLTKCALARLREVTSATYLPSSDELLVSIAQLLTLGSRAQTMIASRQFDSPASCTQSIRETFPLLAATLVETTLNLETEAAFREGGPLAGTGEAVHSTSAAEGIRQLVKVWQNPSNVDSRVGRMTSVCIALPSFTYSVKSLLEILGLQSTFSHTHSLRPPVAISASLSWPASSEH